MTQHCVFFIRSLGWVVMALWRFSYTVRLHLCLFMEDYIRVKIWLSCSQTALTLAIKNICFLFYKARKKKKMLV